MDHEAEIATSRACQRQRDRSVEYATAHNQPMQKALMEMNLQLHHVVSAIAGLPGLRIIRAIVAGECDPAVLAAFRNVHRTSSMDTFKAALNGNDRAEHVFALTQSLELHDVYQAKMLECDRRLRTTLATSGADTEHDASKLPRPRTKTGQGSPPSFDVRAALYGVLGKDLRACPGAKLVTSWLCLAPGNKISGGKLLS